MLIDFSGVGNDPKNRRFRTVSQGVTYDPQAEFIKMWIPALGELPPEQAHAPWTAQAAAAREEDEEGSHQEQQHEAEVGRESMPVPMVAVATQMKYVPQPAV